MTNLDSILKSRDITLPTKVHLVKAIVFPVVMYGCVVCYSERMQVTVGMGQWPGDFPTQLEDSLARGVTRTALASPGTSVRWRAWGWQPWVSPSLGVQGFSWGSPFRRSPSRRRAENLGGLSPPPLPTLLAEIPSVARSPRQTSTLFCGRTFTSQELGAKVKQPWARVTL